MNVNIVLLEGSIDRESLDLLFNKDIVVISKIEDIFLHK